MRRSIEDLASGLGADPLLVQGSGGNISWKEGDVLWVKASGTQFAQASNQDIFVPVDLSHLREAISVRNFSSAPRVVSKSDLRPSIETFFHALIPQKIVVHLHAVDALTYLVRNDWVSEIEQRLPEEVLAGFVPYRMPGNDLAEAIGDLLLTRPELNTFFLQNHGLIVAAETIQEVKRLLTMVLGCLKTLPDEQDVDLVAVQVHPGFEIVSDLRIHQLAQNSLFFDRLTSDWAISPDHVVFLGARPTVVEPGDLAIVRNPRANQATPFVFVRGEGVYSAAGYSKSQLAQLSCYLDVLSRQPEGQPMHTLSDSEVASLLDWEAEKYRQTLAAKQAK